jgi:hypothetical protein
MIKRDDSGKIVEFEDEASFSRTSQESLSKKKEGDQQDTKNDLVFASEDDIDRAYGRELATAKVALENSIKAGMKLLTDKVSQINRKWEEAKAASRSRKEAKIKEAEADFKLAVEVANECSKTEFAEARDVWYKEMTPVNQAAEAMGASLHSSFETEVENCKRRRSQRQVILAEAKRLEEETAKEHEQSLKKTEGEKAVEETESKPAESKPAESKPAESKPAESKSAKPKSAKSKTKSPAKKPEDPAG